MSNDFLANIQHEGETFNFEKLGNKEEQALVESERQEKETPAESPADTKPKVDETASPAEEKKIDVSETPEEGEKPEVYHAFHEHPRFQALIKEREELKEELSSLREFQRRAEPILKDLSRSEEDKSIPAEFRALYGEDEIAWKNFQALTAKQQEKFLGEIEKKLQPFIESAEKTKQKAELDAWAENEWNALENDPQAKTDLKKFGKTFDDATKGEIQQVVSDYLPTDPETGKVSLKRGFDLWKRIQSSSSVVKPNPEVEEKKKIADATMKKSSPAEGLKDYKTSADFIGKSFSDFNI